MCIESRARRRELRALRAAAAGRAPAAAEGQAVWGRVAADGRAGARAAPPDGRAARGGPPQDGGGVSGGGRRRQGCSGGALDGARARGHIVFHGRRGELVWAFLSVPHEVPDKVAHQVANANDLRGVSR